MFTGIIEWMGTVVERRETAAGLTFGVRAPGMELGPGDSVSINGVCHTVERTDADVFWVTSIPETLAKTTMGDLEPDHEVNLELAATPATALGGHIVQGHVDGVGRVVDFAATSEGERLLTVELPAAVHDVVVDKGSIALDGVSLTVARRHGDPRVTIAIIPYTLEHTVIGSYQKGHRVNVEADVIGKYVRQYMDRLELNQPR